MNRKRLIIWTFSFIALLAIVLWALNKYGNFSADEIESVTVSGYVEDGYVTYYVQPSNPAVGVTVKLKGQKNTYSGVTDENGHFSVKIEKIDVCPFDMIYGGNGYNWKSNGSISCGENAMPGQDLNNIYLVADKDINLSWSKWFGSPYSRDWCILSDFDECYVKQKIEGDKLANPSAPGSAEITISPQGIIGQDVLDMNNETFKATISVYANLGDWGREHPGISGMLAETDINLSKENYQNPIKIPVSLASLSEGQRYQAYLNGFHIKLKDKLDHIQNWNAVLTLGGSKDVSSATIDYKDIKEIVVAKSFSEPLHKPIDSYHTPGARGDFGPRVHPVTGRTGFHNGVDLSGSSTIYSVNSGEVISITNDSIWGNRIGIKHCNDIITYYNHIQKGSIKVRVGQKVGNGEEIASVGSTGRSTGPHLHFIVNIDGEDVDPWPYIKDL